MGIDYVVHFIGTAVENLGQEYQCCLYAVVALLFFRYILNLSNFLVTVLLLVPGMVFVSGIDSKAFFPNLTNEQLIVACWVAEAFALTSLKMIAGLLSAFNPFSSPVYSVVIALSCMAALAFTLQPALLQKYLPGVELETVYLVTFGLPFSMGIWKSIKTVVPICLWSIAIVGTLLFLSKNQQVINIEKGEKLLAQSKVAQAAEEFTKQNVMLLASSKGV